MDAFGDGAGGGNRTPDLLITNQLLYQLSYKGNGLYFTQLLLYTLKARHFLSIEPTLFDSF